MRHLTGLVKWLRLAPLLMKPRSESFGLRFFLYAAAKMHHEKLTVLNGKTYTNTRYPALESRAYRTAWEGLARLRRGEQPLMRVCFALTSRCPLNCVYCSAKNFPPAPDLPTRRWVELVREVQDLGCYSINFSGGEPLERADLPEIVSAVDDRSVAILTTSGCGFPKSAKTLRRAGVEIVSVSIDSFDEARQNERRGHPDALNIAVDAVRTASRMGFFTAVEMVPDASMLTPRVMDGFVGNASRLGAHQVILLAPRPCVALGRHHFRGFSPAQLRKLHRFQFHYNRMAGLPTVTSIDFTEDPSFHGCAGGTVYVYVSASGEVTPCPFHPVSFGNVRDRPLAEVFANMRRTIRYPGSRCGLARVFHLIRDVPDDALPIRDPKTIDRIYRKLSADRDPLPDFWKRVGLRKERHTAT